MIYFKLDLFWRLLFSGLCLFEPRRPSTVLPGVLKADQRSHDEKCVNWNEAAIRELLTIRAEAEIVRQFSEMVRGALYMSHEMSRVFMGSLRVV